MTRPEFEWELDARREDRRARRAAVRDAIRRINWRAIALHMTVILMLVRALAPAPEASDPPDMHAFYERWLRPPLWLIVAPAAAVFVWDVVTAFCTGWRRNG